MENKMLKFSSLTSEILKENKQVYTEALDYAFSNDDIRNIAITGVYGAGKSTVWNTYRKHRSEESESSIFNNVITVCLGKYEDNYDNNIGAKTNIDLKDRLDDKTEKELDNRVERQIINQILAQINSSKIPLSKYKFKGDISKGNLWINIVLTLLFSNSIILLIYLKSIFNYLKNLSGDLSAIVSLAIAFFILFFIPGGYYLFNFYKKNKVKFSKVSFKVAEAEVSETHNDETVLERDMKEIVYLLSSSKTRIVVFEDLDRYDSVDIFIKLKELNFLLNAYLETNELNRVVKFVYLIKDSLFYSKDRTKFFDFILPIVPVVDSKTSENYLNNMLNIVDDKRDNTLNKKTLWNISLYIDDMRILRNIVNEYKVYSEIVPVSDIKLDENKLFALITLKNIYPNEFDLLQEDSGYVKKVFDRIKQYRIKLIDKFQLQYQETHEKLVELHKEMAENIFEKMSLFILKDVVISNDKENETWANFLQNWEKHPETYYRVSSNSINGTYQYEEFLKRFVYTDQKKKEEIEKLRKEKSSQIHELSDKSNELRRKIDEVKVFQIKEVISELTPEEIDELFEEKDKNLMPRKYPLIRYLVVEGLLNETYWYYKGNFDINNSNTLKQNDSIFMKRLLEKEQPDIFLKLESPQEIMNRLELMDFRRFGILNRDLLEVCVKNREEDKVLNILKTVDLYKNHEDLVKVINDLPYAVTDFIVDKMVEKSNYMLGRVLEKCEEKYNIALNNITFSIIMNKKVTANKLKSYKDFIESNEQLIEAVEEDKFDEFIEMLREKNITFSNLQKIQVTKKDVINEGIEKEQNLNVEINKNLLRKKLVQIEKYQLYKIRITNLLYLSEHILNRKIKYGRLLSVVFEEKELSSSKNYLEDAFILFCDQYINGNDNDEEYSNGEDVFLRILNLEISFEDKLKYINKTNQKISCLKDLIKDDDILDIIQALFKNNQVEFNAENLNYYWDIIQENDSEKPNETEKLVLNFTNTLNSMISKKIIKHNKDNDKKEKNKILVQCESICNELINSSSVSDELFRYLVDNAKKPITILNSELKNNRIQALSDKNMIKSNEDNIQLLIDKSLSEELKQLVERNENTIIPILRNMELSDETIYSIVNADISTDNAKSLLTKLKGSVQIDKINPEKTELIESIQNDNF